MVERKLKPVFWDILPILLILFIAATPLLRQGESAKSVKIISCDHIECISISVDTTFTIESRVGPAVISIKDRRARVVSASCPHKICVKTGWISRPGSVIICAPGRVAVIIEGEGSLDAITR